MSDDQIDGMSDTMLKMLNVINEERAAREKLASALMGFMDCASTQPTMDGKTVISGWNPMKLEKAYGRAVNALRIERGQDV